MATAPNPVSDYYRYASPYVVATPRPAGKGILITTTVAGNAVLQLDDPNSSTVTVTLSVGTITLPLAVSNVVSQTATASYWAVS